MRTIRVVIRRDGTQDIEVMGGSGPGCVELTRRLERRLGEAAGERALRPEHDDPPREGAADERERSGEREGAS